MNDFLAMTQDELAESRREQAAYHAAMDAAASYAAYVEQMACEGTEGEIEAPDERDEDVVYESKLYP